MRNPLKILKAYMANKADWEDICLRCGMCCYERTFYPDGSVSIDITNPCEFLDESTKMCSVYESRYADCHGCHKVGIKEALSKRTLPPSCAYRILFEDI